MTANRRWEPLLIAVLALLAAGWAESSVPLSSLPGVVIARTAAVRFSKPQATSSVDQASRSKRR